MEGLWWGGGVECGGGCGNDGDVTPGNDGVVAEAGMGGSRTGAGLSTVVCPSHGVHRGPLRFKENTCVVDLLEEIY